MTIPIGWLVIGALRMAASASAIAQIGGGSETADLTPVRVGVALHLTPESLVASGLDAQDIAALLAAIESEEPCDNFNTLAESQHAAAEAVAEALQHIQTGPTETFGVQECDAAFASLETCNSAMQQAEVDLYDDVTESFAATVITRLSAWRDSVQYLVPPEFRVVSRSADEWRLLARAARAEERAARTGETLSETYATALAAARASQEVTDAASRLANYLDAAEAAFAAADQGSE